MILVAAGILLSAFGLMRFWLDYDAVNAALTYRNNDQQFAALAREVLRQITSNTRFEGHWRVNDDPTRDDLTVLLFRGGSYLPEALKPYERNCGYTGHRPIVICDITIIESLDDRWGFNRSLVEAPAGAARADAPRPMARRQPCSQHGECLPLMAWLLAHELGHVLAGHGPSRFAHGALDHYVKDATVSERRELIADQFAVTSMGAPVPGNSFYQAIIAALNAEIRLKLCPDTPIDARCRAIGYGAGIYPPQRVVEFSAGGSHPEYVVRIIRLLQEAEQTYHMRFFGPLVDITANGFRAKAPGN
jgi:hypothetical protein